MKLKASDFTRATQKRVARIAVSAPATRGQGRGVVKGARAFLGSLQLRYFSVQTAGAFRRQLDKATEALRLALPSGAKSWGLARKLMNIFLRDALYTTYLCERFRLDAAEKFLEVPLDSIISRHLRKEAGRGVLPRWKGVKHLTPDVSDKYQICAEDFARANGLARVHLDTYWYGARVGSDIRSTK